MTENDEIKNILLWDVGVAEGVFAGERMYFEVKFAEQFDATPVVTITLELPDLSGSAPVCYLTKVDTAGFTCRFERGAERIIGDIQFRLHWSAQRSDW